MLSSDGPGEYDVAFEVRARQLAIAAACVGCRPATAADLACLWVNPVCFSSSCAARISMVNLLQAHPASSIRHSPPNRSCAPQAFAGVAPQTLQPGTVAYIGTGGPLPEGSDAGLLSCCL